MHENIGGGKVQLSWFQKIVCVKRYRHLYYFE